MKVARVRLNEALSENYEPYRKAFIDFIQETHDLVLKDETVDYESKGRIGEVLASLKVGVNTVFIDHPKTKVDRKQLNVFKKQQVKTEGESNATANTT